MKTLVRAFHKTKKLLTGVAAVGLLAGAVGLALPAGNAAAFTCRVQSATSAGSEGDWVYSSTYFVPNASVSGCKDINVRNIQNQTVPGDHCATFKVQFFPTWGQPYFNSAKTVCSVGANGTIVPIATDVLNGTKYRIWYNLEGNFQAHTYQVID